MFVRLGNIQNLDIKNIILLLILLKTTHFCSRIANVGVAQVQVRQRGGDVSQRRLCVAEDCKGNKWQRFTMLLILALTLKFSLPPAARPISC